LRQIDASGTVRCVILGPNGPEDIRKIDCETLNLLTCAHADRAAFCQEHPARWVRFTRSMLSGT